MKGMVAALALLLLPLWAMAQQAEGVPTPQGPDNRSITTWLVAGPFPNADYEAFHRDCIGEADVVPEEGAPAGDATWLPLDDRLYCRNYDDYNDLYTFFRYRPGGDPATPTDWAVAYAHTWIWSPDRKSCVLQIGSNDGFRAWLNGRLAGEVEGQYRQAERGSDALEVELAAGWNRLLIKVANAYGVWGFYAVLADDAGQPLQGLEYSIRPPEGPLQVSTTQLPRGYAEWPYVWLSVNVPERPDLAPTEIIRRNTPEASPFRLEARGGTPPYRWEIAGGRLPAGLTLDPEEGELLGICAEEGDATFTARVTDAEGKTAERELAITVAPRPNAWHEDAVLVALVHNAPSGEDIRFGDPEQQAALMSMAGYAYAAPVSKHTQSDAFPFWPTRVLPPQGDGDLAFRDPGPPKYGDLISPLVKAMRERGVRVGFYYPIVEMENGPGGWVFQNWFPRYVDFMLAQMEELCRTYRPAVIWLDGGALPYDRYRKTGEGCNYEYDAVYGLIKTLVPECLVLSNTGKEMEYGLGDIDALVCESEGGETLDWYWGRWPTGQDGNSPKRLSTEVWRLPNTGDSFLGDDRFMDWQEWARVVVSMRCEGYVCNLDHSGWVQRYASAMRLNLAQWIRPRLHTLEGTRPGPLDEGLWGYDVIKGDTLYLHILENERGKFGFRGKSRRGLAVGTDSLLGDLEWVPQVSQELSVGPVDRPIRRIYQVPLDMDLGYTVERDRVTIDMTRVVVDDVDTIIAIELGPAK